MHSFKIRAAVLGAIALTCVFLAPPASRGDEWNLMTIFRVSHPFEVPGARLEADTHYVIRLLDSQSTRNVVQIFNQDQDELLATFIAVSAYRLEPEDETVFTFIETLQGQPLPVRKWFYPGRLNGLEFVYPKGRAMEIAAHAKEPVLAVEGDVDLSDLSSIDIVAVSPEEYETRRTTAATAAGVPEEEPAAIAEQQNEEEALQEWLDESQRDASVAMAENQEDGGLTIDAEAQREKPSEHAITAESEPEEGELEELPATAGELPLLGLIGMLALGAALGLRASQARS